MSSGPDSVADYLSALPDPTRIVLEELRAVVLEELPGAEETMSYGMPTYLLAGRRVVHLAGWAKHVSAYPMPTGDPELERDAAAYLSGKGTVRFPLTEPLPVDLVRRMVRALASAG